MFSFFNIEIEGDKGYFVDLYRGCICRASLCNGKVELMAEIPAPYMKRGLTYGVISKISNKYIIMPYRGDDILEYDIEKNVFTEIQGLSGNHRGALYTRFMFCGKYKDMCYFVSQSYGGFIIYDMVTGRYKHLLHAQDVEKIFPQGNIGDAFANWEVISGCFIYQGSVFLTSPRANIILEVNLETEKIRQHIVGDSGWSYQDISRDGKDFWILQKKSGILVKWNYESGEANEYTTHLSAIADASLEYPFGFINCRDGKIELYATSSSCNIKLNPLAGKDVEMIPVDGKEGVIFFQNIYPNGYAWMEWPYLGKLVGLHLRLPGESIERKVELTASAKYKNKIRLDVLRKNFVQEYDGESLTDYITSLVSTHVRADTETKLEPKGSEIYKCIVSERRS